VIGRPVLRLVVEAPDGVRVVFSAPAMFLAGSVRCLLNGMWQRLDYHVEISQTQIRVEEPPAASSSLEVWFVPI
jgi:hypothetical protein